MTEITDELLMAYADNQLESSDRSRVEEALAADPALREKLSKHYLLKAEIDLAFNDIVDAPVPETLISLLKQEPSDSKVADLAAHRKSKTRIWQQPAMTAAALAACLVIGVFLGQQSFLSGPSQTGVTLSDTLADALGSQPALSAQGSVTPVASFTNSDGEFCRRFRLSEPAPQEGLACRDAIGDWSILALVPNAEADMFRPAGERPLSTIDQLTQNMVRLSNDEEAARLID